MARRSRSSRASTPDTDGANTSASPFAADTIDVGFGPVLARRHRNPDRTVGGWVADSAHAEQDVWVGPNAFVLGNARVFGGARIDGEAMVVDNARLLDGAMVDGAAVIGGDCTVGRAHVGGHARIGGRAHIDGGASISGNATVKGEARVLGAVVVDDEASVAGRAWLSGGKVTGSAQVSGDATVLAGMVIGEATGEVTASSIELARPETSDDQVDLEVALAELDFDLPPFDEALTD